jgi:enoyl-[acyl-carrier protein] reductase I
MHHDFLQLSGRRIVVYGIANRRSVAAYIALALREAGAEVIASVQGPEQQAAAAKLLPGVPIHLCDVRDEAALAAQAEAIGRAHGPLHGLVHSLAFANFADGPKPFHETSQADFLDAVAVSCHSLIAMARHFKPWLDPDAAIVAMSISTTRMAAESYGYMAPVKAALDSSVVFLAKSLAADTRIRVNAVGASLLKTSASAGIPGYVEPYLYAEKATLRHRALATEEVANVAAFLLSPRSSGINAQTVVVDAGMGVNFFDRDLVRAAVRSP